MLKRLFFSANLQSIKIFKKKKKQTLFKIFNLVSSLLLTDVKVRNCGTCSCLNIPSGSVPHFTKLCWGVAIVTLSRELSQLVYMLLGKGERTINAVGERWLQEQVLSMWGTWDSMHKGKDCYKTGAHWGPWATLVERKTEQTAKDAGTSGDTVLGRMRSFFVVFVVVCFALFCFVSISLFNERRDRVISSVMITKKQQQQKRKVWMCLPREQNKQSAIER